MTSAPITNPSDVIFIPRVDSTPSPKGDSSFAGNLRSAVEKNGPSTAQTQTPKSGKKEQVVKKEKSVKADEKEPDNSLKKPMDSTEPNDQKLDSEMKSDLKSDVGSEAEELSEDELDAVTEKVNSLMQEISKITGVEEEDILVALENLGITVADLFVPENMTNLLMELNETEDLMELVTDENLFTSLKGLNAQASEIMGEIQEVLDLSPEDVQKVLEQVVTQEQDVVPEQIPAEHVQAAEVVEMPGSKVEESNMAAVQTESQTTESVDAISKMDTVAVDKAQENSPVASEEENADSQNFKEDENGFSDGESSKEAVTRTSDRKEEPVRTHRTEKSDTQPAVHQVTQHVQHQFLQNEVNAVQESEVVSNNNRTVETQRIADQIMEHMKVQLKEGVTELEMQLHPASLGNVNVSLVSREGNITAQFIAQNEAVKNAIEAQLVQLKEQFEEQGIKVEAVEVAVFGHQFERQDNGQGQRESQKSGGGSNRRTRRINLDALSDEELSKLTDESDKIQVDMMNRNGNTVDYTV